MAALVVLVVFGAAACGPRSQQSSAPPAPTVQTTAAVSGVVQPTETLPGIIAPSQNVEISNTLAEPAASVPVQEGDVVHQGQVLAVLATQDLQANLEAAQRTYEEDEAKVTQARDLAQLAINQGSDQVGQAQGALNQAQANLTQAQGLYTRDQSLYSQGAIARQDLDTQQGVVKNDQGAVQAAQAALASAIANRATNGTPSSGLQAANVAAAAATAAAAQAQAEQISAQIARATITSPIDGVVVNRNLNPGEYPGTRTLFVVQELSTVYAMLNGTGTQTESVSVGAPVVVSASSLPGRTYRGTVAAVLGEVVPGSTNFTVKVGLTNPGLVLRSGLAVTGQISLPQVRGITIPTSAFLDDTHTTVAVVTTSPQVRHVQELASDGTTSVVTGLNAGDRVAVDGQQASSLTASPGTP